MFTVVTVLWRCWLGVRKSIRPVKIEWWGAGMVICVERNANDLHMVQLTNWCHCHRIVSCLIKIQIGLAFLVPSYRDRPGKEPLNGCLSVWQKYHHAHSLARGMTIVGSCLHEWPPGLSDYPWRGTVLLRDHCRLDAGLTQSPAADSASNVPHIHEHRWPYCLAASSI